MTEGGPSFNDASGTMAKRGQHRVGNVAIPAAEKRSRAIELRRAGSSYEQIAKDVGFANRGTAFRAVQIGLRESLQEAGSEDLRSLELERLECLQRSRWSKAVGGDDKAFDRVLAIMKRRAELMGLDAPVKLQHGGDGSKPVVVKVLRGVSSDEL